MSVSRLAGPLAARAGSVHESLVQRQRRLAGRAELRVLRQQHWQVVLRDGHGAAVVAVDDRNRRAPVALARNEPVAHPVLNGPLAPALRLDEIGDALLRLDAGQAVELAGAHLGALVDVGLGQLPTVPVRRRDDDRDRQIVFLGELEVALVVRRDAHDDAGAVCEQHVVADKDGHTVSVQPVDRVGAGEHARLDLLGRHAFDLGLAARLVHVGLDLGPVLRRRQPVHQRVLWGQHDERHAEDRVDARREGSQRRLIEAVLGYVELDVDALAAADPVGLHDVDLLWPVDLGLVQQLVRVLRDAEQPLVQLAANDLGVAALAAAVHDLLVGQHGVVGRAPVGGREVAVGQTGLQELQEYPLVPPVVLGHARDELAVPVVDCPH